MFTRSIFALAIMVLLANAAHAAEEKKPDWNAETLTGDWGGTRSSLYDKGIDLGFTHKSDFLSNLSGGLKRGTAWMGHSEARLNLDMEELLGWGGTTSYIHLHSDLGSKFNRDYAGSFNGVDNIETPANTAQFYQAWIQKNYSDDSLSVLAGLYAIDSEFYVTDTSGLFIQPPYGMANDMAQSGQNGSPVFPTGALAVRLKYTAPDKSFYTQYALTDGVPGDPNSPYGTHIQLNKGDGTLSVLEFGLTPQSGESGAEAESFNKTAIGFWRYTAQLDDTVDLDTSGNPVRRPDQGIYFLFERTLKVEKDQPSQGLSGFVRFGTANGDIHQADWTGSIGLRYHGLLEGRDDDIAGIAITCNHASDKYRTNNNAERADIGVEATYRAQVNPWLAVQPTVQYIANPNMDSALQNIWIVGARAEVSF